MRDFKTLSSPEAAILLFRTLTKKERGLWEQG